MLNIFVISSQVIRGHVGLAAILPAVQALGHEVFALPTIILSNHPGHNHAAGEQVSLLTLESIVSALDKNGWLADIDCILTGYMPSVEHVNFAAATIMRIKNKSPSVKVICDPIIGDKADGIYIDLKAAKAIRDRLIPLSDVMLPNKFELIWLTETDVKSETDVLLAGHAFPEITIITTSVPTNQHNIMANVLSLAKTANSPAMSCRFNVHPDVPKGTGDFFSGLIAAGATFDLATSQTSALAALSVGKQHLDIVTRSKDWIAAEPLLTLPVKS
ncbi:MAG: bifunctional hydroxymethylpyrimidine kinase/phosphomethylpyrimidine kinase [Hyphomicrobiaceae bacterium]|nr:bifunctional hydroxymethylpyrimidine kinase/phosphomethylpyrimidine kinase [Hyphomicrobiaceae bacterium]